MIPPQPFLDSAVTATTWTYKRGSCSVIERGVRIRPERAHRRNVQKVAWRNSRWLKSYSNDLTGKCKGGGICGNGLEPIDERLSSMTVSDVGPTVAIRRILLLYENYQFREAANFINRLNHATFRSILSQLPIDLFVEALPQSLPVLEALYAKVFLSDGLNCAIKQLRPEGVVWHLVHFFARQDDTITTNLLQSGGLFYNSCKKLLKVIVLSEPKIRKALQMRRRSLNKSLAGLGQHGLVGTSDQALIDLHDALKLEFEKLIHQYKAAVQKLDMSLAPKTPVTRSVSYGPAPTNASHQRQLSLKQAEIQERLIKNKTILNVVEPSLSNRSLEVLLEILQRRIEYDKDVLFQFTQIKKEAKDVHPNAIVAPVLMRFSHGCDQVLSLMREVANDHNNEDDDDDDSSSDISGYHSDSDSAVIINGINSPFVSKRARYNFLYRSGTLEVFKSVKALIGVGGDSIPASFTVFYTEEMKAGDNPTSIPLGNSVDVEAKQGDSEEATNEENVRSNSRGSRGGPGGSSSDSQTHDDRGQQGDGSRSRTKLQKSDITLISSNGTVAKNMEGRSLSRSPSHDREIVALRQEVEGLRCELLKAKQALQSMHDREQKMKERLAEQAQKMLERGSKFENVALGEKRPTALIRRYGNLYAQARVDTLDALDSLPELRDAEELKAKLLFSVVVLAFRSVQSTLREIRKTVRRVLQMPDLGSKDPTADPASREVETSIALYLRRTVDRYDIKGNVEEVCSQIWATLYDYPCLKTCEGLVQYIRDCVKLAWGLSNQTPPFVVEYETRLFRRDMHVRFHTSNQESDHIKTYLWPALLEGDNGPCVHKGVVIT